MLRGGYLGEGVGGKKRRAMGDDERREEQKTGAAPSRFKSSQSHTANTPQTSAFETITPHLPHPIQSTVPYSKSNRCSPSFSVAALTSRRHVFVVGLRSLCGSDSKGNVRAAPSWPRGHCPQPRDMRSSQGKASTAKGSYAGHQEEDQ